MIMGLSADVPFRNAFKDPNVKLRLAEGVLACDVWLIECMACGNYSYYNQGSHFNCSVDKCGWSCEGDGLDRVIADGHVTTLDDYLESLVCPDTES